MNFYSEAIPGTEITADGRKFLYFGGTSYLGMQRDPEFLQMMSGYLLRLGSHWGASRVGNVKLPVYGKAEEALAFWMGSPSCLTLSSGFLAARFLAEYFLRQHYTCFYSPNCHEALLAPGAIRQPDWVALGQALEDHRARAGEKLPVVFTDSMGGPRRPGPVWDRLKTMTRDCILVVDDSHGLGISGPDGSGSWRPLHSMGFNELVLCGSLGKAMGVPAGLIAGTRRRMDALRETPFFAGASPASPAGISALVNALENGVYQKKLNQLKLRVNFLQSRVRDLGFLSFQEEYPVLSFREERLVRHLLDRDILITHFEYPAEGATPTQNRIVLTAAHGEPQLQYLADVLTGFRDS